MTRIPDFDDVRAAARRLAGHARLTPLLADTPLDRLTGGRIFPSHDPVFWERAVKAPESYT